jgi:hypothetical protein
VKLRTLQPGGLDQPVSLAGSRRQTKARGGRDWWLRASRANAILPRHRTRAILRHPDPLVLPTLLADAAMDVRGIGSVLEVAAAGGRQHSIKVC